MNYSANKIFIFTDSTITINFYLKYFFDMNEKKYKKIVIVPCGTSRYY